MIKKAARTGVTALATHPVVRVPAVLLRGVRTSPLLVIHSLPGVPAPAGFVSVESEFEQQLRGHIGPPPPPWSGLSARYSFIAALSCPEFLDQSRTLFCTEGKRSKGIQSVIEIKEFNQ